MSVFSLWAHLNIIYRILNILWAIHILNKQLWVRGSSVLILRQANTVLANIMLFFLIFQSTKANLTLMVSQSELTKAHLTLNRASAGVFARTLLYCTVLYCTLIVFSPNTTPLTTTKYQGPQTCISSSDLYFKIQSMPSSLLI